MRSEFASLPVLIEYCIPFLKQGACFGYEKATKMNLEDAKNIMKELDCAYVGQDHYVLPFEMQREGNLYFWEA